MNGNAAGQDGQRPTNLICLSTTAARAYVDGLLAACQILEDHDVRWGSDTAEHRRCIRHEAEMFVSYWETRNQIRLGSLVPQMPTLTALAHQATIIMHPAAAARIGTEMMMHAEAMSLGVGRIPDDKSLATVAADLVRHRILQLQNELRELVTSRSEPAS